MLGRVLEREALESALSENVSLVEAERQLVDIHHGELGARLATLWGLPEPIVHGIRHHHEPDNANSDLAPEVALADAVTHDLLGDQLGCSEQLDDRVTVAAGAALCVAAANFAHSQRLVYDALASSLIVRSTTTEASSALDVLDYRSRAVYTARGASFSPKRARATKDPLPGSARCSPSSTMT